MRKLVLSLEKTADNQKLLDTLSTNENYQIISFADLQKEKATIIVNGPLTELAHQLVQNYKLAENIEQIIFVGGSATLGDVTVAAEKNVYADIYSAKYVFNSNLPIVMIGLDATRALESRSLLPLQYLENKESFIYDECGIYVEANGPITKGKTVCDCYSDRQFSKHNCIVVLGIK